jgi:hypothetical protein
MKNNYLEERFDTSSARQFFIPKQNGQILKSPTVSLSVISISRFRIEVIDVDDKGLVSVTRKKHVVSHDV